MGTVWTLKYEVLCYAGVLALGLAGLLRSRAFALALVAGLALAVAGLDLLAPDAGKGVQTALRLPLVFAAGGALYLWREGVRLSGLALAGLLVAAVLLQDTFAYRAVLFLAEAYGVIWLALAPGLSHLALDPTADLSYGTYLYGWPIQQSLVQLWPAASPLVLLGPAVGAHADGRGAVLVPGREAGAGPEGSADGAPPDARASLARSSLTAAISPSTPSL